MNVTAVHAHEMGLLAQAVIDRITLPLEASGRHVHLCRAHVEALFGPG